MVAMKSIENRIDLLFIQVRRSLSSPVPMMTLRIKLDLHSEFLWRGPGKMAPEMSVILMMQIPSCFCRRLVLILALPTTGGMWLNGRWCSPPRTSLIEAEEG